LHRGCTNSLRELWYIVDADHRSRAQIGGIGDHVLDRAPVTGAVVQRKLDLRWASVLSKAGWTLLRRRIEKRQWTEDDMNTVVLGETPKGCQLLGRRQRRHRRRDWRGGEHKSTGRGGAANVPTECRHESV